MRFELYNHAGCQITPPLGALIGTSSEASSWGVPIAGRTYEAIASDVLLCLYGVAGWYATAQYPPDEVFRLRIVSLRRTIPEFELDGDALTAARLRVLHRLYPDRAIMRPQEFYPRGTVVLPSWYTHSLDSHQLRLWADLCFGTIEDVSGLGMRVSFAGYGFERRWCDEQLRNVPRTAPVVQEEHVEILDSTVFEISGSSRHFGLEFEFLQTRPQDEFAQALGRAARSLSTLNPSFPFHDGGYRHSEGNSWDLKTDSSCGLEFCTPALSMEQWPMVDHMLAALRASGARVDRRCGLHVHHQCSDLSPSSLRRLMLLWMAYEDVLFGLVEPARYGNSYCQPYKEYYTTWEDMKNSLIPLRNLETEVENTGKYRALNVSGWWRHGRVEVRIHHGTLDAGLAKFWTLLTQRMVEVAVLTRNYKEMEDAFREDFQEKAEHFQRMLNHTPLAKLVNKVLKLKTPTYKELPYA